MASLALETKQDGLLTQSLLTQISAIDEEKQVQKRHRRDYEEIDFESELALGPRIEDKGGLPKPNEA
jgi:hypothetical protein